MRGDSFPQGLDFAEGGVEGMSPRLSPTQLCQRRLRGARVGIGGLPCGTSVPDGGSPESPSDLRVRSGGRFGFERKNWRGFWGEPTIKRRRAAARPVRARSRRNRSPRERRGMTWIYLLGAVAVLIVLLVVGLVVLAAPSDEDRHPSS